MRGHRTRRRSIPLGVMIVIGLATLASASWAQDRGACVAANVPDAFTLPDGSVHPAGRLTLCTVRAFTPVVGLHRVWADGGNATLVMSRRGRPEATSDRPEILFQRLSDGTLELVGYVLANGDQSWSYALQRSSRKGFADRSPAIAAQNKGNLVTLLASKVD